MNQHKGAGEAVSGIDTGQGMNPSGTEFLNFQDDILHANSITGINQRSQSVNAVSQDGTGIAYPVNINPAMQHEKLAYMSHNSSHQGEQQIHGYDTDATNASFLDDMFTTSHIPHTMRETSISHTAPHSFPGEAGPPELLFQHGNEDQMVNYTDDMSSSLGSSIHSDLYTPSFGTPASFTLNSNNLDTINSLTSTSYNNNNNNNTFSPSSLRSPSSSIRPNANTSYLSTSLRQPSTLSNCNTNNTSTPNSRNPSVSYAVNNSIDTNLSSSVPKTISNLSHDDRLRRKRDFHNAVERRRRDLIKQKINELGNLVPPSLLCFDSHGKQIKPNKGIILNKTVEYVHFLFKVLESQHYKREQLIQRTEELENKFNNLDLKGLPQNSSVSIPSAKTLTDNNTKGVQHIPEGQERIIDSRAYPDPHIQIKDNLHDDLHQFLSGNIIEAQDNAKLMFGDSINDISGHASNQADYLLEFDS